jgi:hypothetical protein
MAQVYAQLTTSILKKSIPLARRRARELGFEVEEVGEFPNAVRLHFSRSSNGTYVQEERGQTPLDQLKDFVKDL